MTICDDRIQFDQSSDWQQVIAQSKSATILGENSYIPIGSFDLGVALSESFVAIVVQAINAKPTWIYAGEVRQSWEFPAGNSIGSLYGRVQSTPTHLRLNKVQYIKLSKNTPNACRLRYTPPTWFKELIIVGWKYVGAVENFTRDTLFDLGNKIGIGTINEPDSLSNLLIAQETLLQTIQDRLDDIETNLNNQGPINFTVSDQITALDQNVSQNVSQINQDIQALSQNLSSVLSGESSPDILQANVNQTIIEEEFL